MHYVTGGIHYRQQHNELRCKETGEKHLDSKTTHTLAPTIKSIRQLYMSVLYSILKSMVRLLQMAPNNANVMV